MKKILVALVVALPALALGQASPPPSITLGSGATLSDGAYSASAASGDPAYSAKAGARFVFDSDVASGSYITLTSSLLTGSVGFSAPTFAASVASGSVGLSVKAGAKLGLNNDGSNTYTLSEDGSNILLAAPSSKGFKFTVNGTDELVVSSAGAVTSTGALSNGTFVATGGALTGLTTAVASGLITASDVTLADTKAGRPTLTLNATDGKQALAAIVGGSGEILAIGYDGSGAGITTIDLGPTAFADGGQIQMTAALVTIPPPISAGSSKNKGTKTLTGGTGTVTVNSGATCVCSNATSAVTPCRAVVVTTTLTITSGAGTDDATYVCL